MRHGKVAICMVPAVVFCLTGTAGSENRGTELTFDQVKPYITCLIYVDSATQQLRMCTPEFKKVQRRLVRCNLTNTRLLKAVWQAHVNLLEKAEALEESGEEENTIAGWSETWRKAAMQAADNLEGTYERIDDKRDYFDLLDIRISQILSKDVGFLKPLLEEIEKLFEAKATNLSCIDCKEKFAEWLRSVEEDSP